MLIASSNSVLAPASSLCLWWRQEEDWFLRHEPERAKAFQDCDDSTGGDSTGDDSDDESAYEVSER